MEKMQDFFFKVLFEVSDNPANQKWKRLAVTIIIRLHH
jgi:hypothetical protein